jgi:hypothetical protein
MNQGRFYSSMVTNINGDISSKETAVKYNNDDIRGVENINGNLQPIPKKQLRSMLEKMKYTRPRSQSLSQTREFFPNIKDKINLIVQDLSPLPIMDRDIGRDDLHLHIGSRQLFPHRKETRKTNKIRRLMRRHTKKKNSPQVKVAQKKQNSVAQTNKQNNKTQFTSSKTDLKTNSSRRRKKSSKPTKKRSRRR